MSVWTCDGRIDVGALTMVLMGMMDEVIGQSTLHVTTEIDQFSKIIVWRSGQVYELERVNPC